MRKSRRCAFTLAEMMVAIGFISIALFGYISLQLRIIHSSLRLEDHEQVRVRLETALIRMVANSRDMEMPIGIRDLATPQGSTLNLRQQLRCSVPEQAARQKRLEVNLTWTDGIGEHTFHLESYARQEKWGW